MKILLFGGSGQLGREVQKRADDLNFELRSPVITEVNISEREQVLYLAQQVAPDIIINSAAYTAVDKAEEEEQDAYLINEQGARNVAEAARELQVRLIHLSTDYVFEGNGSTPLVESSPTNPLSVYGKSKLAGELAVAQVLGASAIIVRTSSLHGRYGANFVHTMLKLFEERDTLSIVEDQTMSPTWAGWLAEVILDLSRATISEDQIDASGAAIYHACCGGELSWLDFARKIFELSRSSLEEKCGRSIAIDFQPTTAREFGLPAPRPSYSVMNCDKLGALLGRQPISWEQGLKSHLCDVGMMSKAECVGYN